VEILGVGPLPAWVNRFAVNADYALETSQTALTEVKKIWKSSADTLTLATGWLKEHLTIDPALLAVPPPFGQQPQQQPPATAAATAAAPAPAHKDATQAPA
jgi:hypothetical protein